MVISLLIFRLVEFKKFFRHKSLKERRREWKISKFVYFDLWIMQKLERDEWETRLYSN